MEQPVSGKPCLGCSLHRGDRNTIGGVIAASHHFEVRQDYAVPIPGFMIIASKRHVKSLDEFSKEERADFIEFVCAVRLQMRRCLNAQEVTMVQEENSGHFHLWLFPWYAWMQPFGNSVAAMKAIMRYAQEHFRDQVYENEVRCVAEKLKIALVPFCS